jgi:hypothetical protein
MPIRNIRKNVDEILNFKEEKQVFRMERHIDFNTAKYNRTIDHLKPSGYYT